MLQKASATSLVDLSANKEKNMSVLAPAKKALKKFGNSITASQRAATQASQNQALIAASAKKQQEQQAQADYAAKLQRASRPAMAMKKGGAVKKKARKK